MVSGDHSTMYTAAPLASVLCEGKILLLNSVSLCHDFLCHARITWFLHIVHARITWFLHINAFLLKAPLPSRKSATFVESLPTAFFPFPTARNARREIPPPNTDHQNCLFLPEWGASYVSPFGLFWAGGPVMFSGFGRGT